MKPFGSVAALLQDANCICDDMLVSIYIYIYIELELKMYIYIYI